jgi:hypothetical protein
MLLGVSAALLALTACVPEQRPTPGTVRTIGTQPAGTGSISSAGPETEPTASGSPAAATPQSRPD